MKQLAITLLLAVSFTFVGCGSEKKVSPSVTTSQEEILQRIERLNEEIAEIKQIIAENRDNRTKEIGDKVKVWASSSLTDMEGEERLVVNPPFTVRDYFVVTGIQQDATHTDGYENSIEWRQDLVVMNPETEEKFRVSSKHVKIVD